MPRPRRARPVRSVRLWCSCSVVVVSSLVATPALAQFDRTAPAAISASQAAAPAAPPPVPETWYGSVSFGFALTDGNADTSTINLTFDVSDTPKKRNVLKFAGLYLRTTSEGEETADRTALSARDQYALSARSYVFGQVQYLHDRFKDIDYLIAPTGGIGYKLVDGPRTTLAADAGLGFVVEKNPGIDAKTSGAVSTGEKLTHKLTEATTITQSATGLWKTADFDDALYTFGVGLAAALTSQTALKFEFLDVFKNKPPTPDIKKNDTALVASFVFKF